MQNCKISVCVITYNQAKYIGDCLDSIVAQKLNCNYEIVIGDDCSTDGTASILQDYHERYPDIIKPIFRSSNVGGTQNLLDVHNAAVGEYIAHMDGDDLMLPEKLQIQADFLDRNKDFSCVWHRVNIFDDEGNFFDGSRQNLGCFPEGVVTLDHLFRLGSVATHSSIMYRAHARITRSKKFEMLDLFLAWEFLMSGNAKILPNVLGSYRLGAQGSIQKIVNVRRLAAQHAEYYRKLLPGQKENIFVFAFINMIVDLKKFRLTFFDYLVLCVKSFSVVSPALIVKSIRQIEQIRDCPMAFREVEKL